MPRYLGCILFFLAASTCARAQQSIDVVASVRKHDFVALERHFNVLEASFERGDTTEFVLLDAYKPLYMKSDELSEDLAAWIAAFPKSYPAHLARGTYYRKLGEFNRGTEYAVDVPDSTMQYVERVFHIAEGELVTALPLTKKPYLALLNLLNIARYRGDSDASDRYLAEGNKVLPSNMLMRARYLDHLKPRWGGSYAAMSTFVDRCKKEGLSDADLGFLSAMINDDKGLTAQLRRDFQEAAAQYKLALTSAQGASARLKADYLEDAFNACRRGLVPGAPCQ